MKSLREQAIGINKETRDGEIIASYSHDKVKMAVLEFKDLLECRIDIDLNSKIDLLKKFNCIFGDWEK